MTLTRSLRRSPSFTLTPWREFEEASNRMASLLGGSTFSGGMDRGAPWVPTVNVDETPTEIVLTAELPGMSEEDIQIDLENNILTLSGDKRPDTPAEGPDAEARHHLWERRFGAFRRTFALPRTVNAEGIEAHMDRGVLRIRMPKVAEAQSRRIPIHREV
jgi:HSP20 family protein